MPRFHHQPKETSEVIMNNEIVDKLTNPEFKRLMELESVIGKGIEATVKTWIALEEIRDRRLYRQKYGTFDEYCQQKWKMTRQYASLLIKSAAVVKSLPKELSTMVDSPRQARALAVVPVAQRGPVLIEAAKSGAVTAKAITKAAAEIDKPRVTAGPEPVYDMVGIKVTSKAMLYWDRSIEVKEMMGQLSAIKCTIEKAQAAGDKMFIEVGNSTIADLKLCREGISYALPFTVCPTCNGQLVDKCSLCRGRGVVSKRLYETVDAKTREIREKVTKKGGGK
jgi:hypothetical protein